ncbi:MAG: nucleotidyltransferase domain-containing protein [Armatimonadetes bacterium]|nr:nucleotidyltransferase domain-containing protein [Armatimonadota bacterium]
MPVEGRPPWVPSREDIERVAREIAEKFGPERIILFGSYAYGNPTDDSDVDMLVVMETQERPIEAAVRIRLGIEAHFPMDLLVRTPQELAYRIPLNDWFLKEITEKGEVLYERTHAGVADGGGG